MITATQPEELAPEPEQLLRRKVDELAALLMWSRMPDQATRDAVSWLEHEVRYRADLLLGRRRAEALRLPTDLAEDDRREHDRLSLLETIWHGNDPA
jgi:hypothetical protein